MGSGASHCTQDIPCDKRSPCPRCEAAAYLTAEDHYLLAFFRRVRDQYINQTPMGLKDAPSIVTPRLEAYRVALRLYDYPRALWPWLTDGALMVHRLCNHLDEVDWYAECGKGYGAVTFEDVDG